HAPDPGEEHWPDIHDTPTQAQRLRADLALAELMAGGPLEHGLAPSDTVVTASADQAHRVAQWYASLDADARHGLLYRHTDVLRGLEGLPVGARDQANRLALLRLLDPLEQRWRLNSMNETQFRQFQSCTALRELVRDADQLAAGVGEGHRAHVLTLELNEPGRSARSLEIAFGTPESARLQAVHVIGAGNGALAVEGALPDVVAHYAALHRMAPEQGAAVTVRMRGEPLGHGADSAAGRRVGIGRESELDGRRLTGDLAARRAVAEIRGVAAPVHLVVHGSAGDTAGYAGRGGRLADAGVRRVTLVGVDSLGPLEHVAEFRVDEVQVERRGVSPEALAAATAARSARPVDSHAVRAQLDGLRQAAAEVESAAWVVATVDRTRAAARAVAAAWETLRGHGMPDGRVCRELGVSDARIAESPGVPWNVRDELNRAAIAETDAHTRSLPRRSGIGDGRLTSLDHVTEVVHRLEERAADTPGAPQVRLLRTSPDRLGTVIALGDGRPERVVVYVADPVANGGLDQPVQRGAALYDWAMLNTRPGEKPPTVVMLTDTTPGAGRELAHQIAALAGELGAAGGARPQIQVVCEGAGASLVHRAAADGRLSGLVDSVTLVDPVELSGHAADYGIPEVNVSSRHRRLDSAAVRGDPLNPAWGAKWVDYDIEPMGLVAAGRGDEVPHTFAVPVEGLDRAPTHVVDHAYWIDQAGRWVQERMRAQQWGNPAQAHTAAMILAELMGPNMHHGATVTCVIGPGAPGARTMTVSVVDHSGDLPDAWREVPLDQVDGSRVLCLTDLLGRHIRVDPDVDGVTVTFELAEADRTTVRVPPADAPIRETLPADPEVMATEEVRRQQAEARFDEAVERNRELSADDLDPEHLRRTDTTANVAGYRELDWHDRAAMVRDAPEFSHDVAGVTPYWKDVHERVSLRRALDELNQYELLQDSPDRSLRPRMETVVRALAHADRTAAALGTEAYLLHFDVRTGYLEIALGDVGTAAEVNVVTAGGMPLSTVPLAIDYAADVHAASTAERKAALLYFHLEEGRTAEYQARSLLELELSRKYYAALPDGIPDVEHMNFLHRHLNVDELVNYVGSSERPQPTPAAGDGRGGYVHPADAAKVRGQEWAQVLRGSPRDSGALGLRLLDRLAPGAVDTAGLERRLGPMDPAEWARRARADFHPGGFESLHAVAAHVDRRPGAMVAVFADHPAGSRLVLFRNNDGRVQTLDVHDVPRRTVHDTALVDHEPHWRDWEPGPRTEDPHGRRVFGIGFHEPGRPEHQLGAGEQPHGQPGVDQPVEWVGGAVDHADVPHHLRTDVVNECADEGLRFTREVTGNEDVRPFPPGHAHTLTGVDAETYARRSGADWRRGGFRAVDDAAAHVRKHGGVVVVAEEYRGLAVRNNGVGAHLSVLYRGADGEVRRHEQIGTTVRDEAYVWGRSPHPDLRGVYGIVYREVRTEHGVRFEAEVSLRQGHSTAVAGVDRPLSALGADPEPPGPSEPHLFRMADVAPEDQRAAAGAAVRWAHDRMAAFDWQNRGQFRDVEQILDELLQPGTLPRDVTVEVAVVAGDDGARRLQITAIDPDPAGPVHGERLSVEAAESGRGLWVTPALAETWHTQDRPPGHAVTVQLRETQASTAHVPGDGVPVRPTLPRDPVPAVGDMVRAHRAWETYQDRFWSEYPEVDPERMRDTAYRMGLDAAAGVSAFHDLDYADRAALVRRDPSYMDTTAGTTAPWRDRGERLAIVRDLAALDAAAERAPLSENDRISRANLAAMAHGLAHADRTAAALGVEAHLLAFDSGSGIVEIALGNVDYAAEVDIYHVTGMPVRMVAPTLDYVASNHATGGRSDKASVLYFSVYDESTRFQESFIHLQENRRFYARLGIPDIQELRTVDVLTHGDLVFRLGMGREFGPPPDVGAGSSDYARPSVADRARLREWTQLLEGHPRDEGVRGLEALERLLPAGTVDMVGARIHDGPMDPAAWARRAEADFHPDGFTSLGAVAAHVADRPGAMVAAFVDDPAGARVQFFRNIDGVVRTLAVEDLPRHGLHDFALDDVNIDSLWRTWDSGSDTRERITGIAFGPDGVAEHPLPAGQQPQGQRPHTWLGGPEPEVEHWRHPRLNRPDGMQEERNLRNDTANDCTEEGLDFTRAYTGNRDVQRLPHDMFMQLSGVDSATYAQHARGDWRPGGFTDLDQAAAHVRDNGGMIAVAVEFARLVADGQSVGAHLAVLYRDDTGTVRVHQKSGSRIEDYQYAFGWDAPASDRIYGIVYGADGLPEIPLAEGESTAAAAGESRPVSNLGAAGPRLVSPE
ncbi:MAG: hypothetical protein HOQ24_03560, partial [Mycobacteriaceae bacterium]|nr:hypothetical protein [Mycobacteriaceae bacterium]